MSVVLIIIVFRFIYTYGKLYMNAKYFSDGLRLGGCSTKCLHRETCRRMLKIHSRT